MVPRPEDPKEFPERRAVQEEGEIYSNSSDEDCAKLVKAGQLDTFSRPRTIAHQNPGGLLGRSSAERGRTERRPILTERRNARSSSRDTIRVNDRVIVKEKYIGTCRYVGPIEEKYILPEIFIGVELDEPLTNNSGIFGSRQYFDCEHGFGLMVSSTKVRKIRDVAFAPEPKCASRGIKSAKSFTDLSKLAKEPRYRISNGYRQLDRNGKSQTLLNQNLNIFDHDPMTALNNLKRFQNGYGIYPSDIQSHRSAPVTNQYGMPIPIQNSYPFPEGDLLRESFRRIVAPSFQRVDPMLFRNSSLPHIYKAPSSNSQLNAETLFRTRSMPNNVLYDNHGRRISSTGSYSSGIGSSTDQTSNFSTPYYYKYPAPLCPKCATCKLCRPVQISQLSGNTVPNFHPKPNPNPFFRHGANSNPNSNPNFNPNMFRMRNSSDESPPVFSDQNSATTRSTLPVRTQYGSVRQGAVASETAPTLLKSMSFNSIESIEYEKWKANYGKATGRGMKKGLNKLTSALMYS